MKSVEVARGKKGAALINLGEAGDISIKTCLPDGSYTDAVHKASFTVQKGVLKGHADGMSSYILEALSIALISFTSSLFGSLIQSVDHIR